MNSLFRHRINPVSTSQILRYFRMALNRDAGLSVCSSHPNAMSPLLGVYFRDNLLHTEVLERYLNMITVLLNANPGKICATSLS